MRNVINNINIKNKNLYDFVGINCKKFNNVIKIC